MAKPSLAYLFAAFLLLIVSISLSKPSPKSSLYDTFLHCFTQHTNSSTQFSNIVFPQSNPKFPFVTQNYIRNARFNTPSTQKQLLIVTPQVESHVQATVICAKSVNVQLKIRSGGHDYEGVCPTVDVGGHISGGGYDNMLRKHGLSVDNVIDAQIVDVKGNLLNRKTMGEDLFWAIRGGGGASFGVILSFTFKLVPVPKTVTVFRVEKTLEENATDFVL
ncbi:hypothetical protein JHK87_042160 [Glycine soja]|nr:hypothetical protein JHK87_042160 [Glycine soja]